MLAFITSLRHPQNSSDYARVETLLADSLQSILRQDQPEFSVWVVGNRRPERLPRNVHWVPVDFPPPSDLRGPITGRDAFLLDRGTKITIGLLAAAESRPDHVMQFDADDLVSKRLAGVSASDRGANGWRVVEGWRWASDRRAIRRQSDFHRHCGTAYIVRPDLYELPPGLTPRSSQDEIHEAIGNRLFRHLGSHLYLSDDLAAAGHPLAPLPFPAVLYRVGTGENHSGVSLGGLGRPVSRSVASEFGVPSTGLAPTSIVRSILPSERALERIPVLRSRAKRRR